MSDPGASMAEVLRRAKAHTLVDSVEQPALDDDARHHLVRVLRVRDGDAVTVTDGDGSWRLCRAVGGDVVPDGEPQFVPAPVEPVVVAFAIPKQDRPEWIVQKLTELGVDRIVLLHASRSVVRWDEVRATKRVAKLERVAADALQQCRRVRLPVVEGPVPAGRVLAGYAIAEPGGQRVDESVRRIAIGPEGGWSDDELELAGGRVSLAENVLRVETAAVAAATLVAAGGRIR